MVSKNGKNLPNFAKGKLVLKIEYKYRKKLQGTGKNINIENWRRNWPSYGRKFKEGSGLWDSKT